MSQGPPRVGEAGVSDTVASPARLLAVWEERLGSPRETMRAGQELLLALAHAARATRGSLMMVNPATGRLRIAAALGLPAGMVGQDLVPAPRRISDWVLLERQSVIVNGEVSDQRFEGSASRDHIASAMSVPMLGARGPIGVLNLARVSPAGVFDDSDLATVETLTQRVARLLERAQETDIAVAGWRRTRERDREWDLPHGWGGTRSCRVAVARVESVQFAGDFFDRVAHPDGGLTLIVADVFRRGLDAMRLSESVRGLFQAHARYHRSPAEIVARIHDALLRHHPGAYAALWVAGISPNGQLTSCSAGHPPAFCLPTDGGAGQRLALGGPPVGVLTAPFAYREDRLRLLPGDAVVAVSDGLLDSANAAGESFGEGRVEDLLNENRRQPLDRIVHLLCEEAGRFARGIQPVDDIVGLALRFSREE